MSALRHFVASLAYAIAPETTLAKIAPIDASLPTLAQKCKMFADAVEAPTAVLNRYRCVVDLIADEPPWVIQRHWAPMVVCARTPSSVTLKPYICQYWARGSARRMTLIAVRLYTPTGLLIIERHVTICVGRGELSTFVFDLKIRDGSEDVSLASQQEQESQ